MGKWYFRAKVAGETIREPVHSEFFATDAISEPGVALIREGIQNTLDAREENSKVLVRVYLCGDDKAISAANAAPFFGGAWGHFNARDSGLLQSEAPSEESDCSFIAFEDFGTSGLVGDPEEAFRSKQGKQNRFYHFFRAEGQSDKGASDRGIWGVGKDVFLRCSRIRTVFGLTVRASDKARMLMGKSVLKCHWIGERYFQDGFFGVPPQSEGGLVLPVTDRIPVEDFARLFDLQRGNEPGLSLVIPWPDREITDKSIVRAVLHDYFFPILDGQLEVIVESPTVKTVLDSKSLSSEVERLDTEEAAELKGLIDLAGWAIQVSDEEKISTKTPCPRHAAWKWSESLFEEDQIETLRTAYYGGQNMALRVPVTIRKKSNEYQDSFFDVYICRDNTAERGRPVFIREGIIIPKVNAPRTRGVRSIVIAEDSPLAGFLRRAENPSHTEWQHVRLKNEYKYGYRSDLEFVQRSVHEIVRILTIAEGKEDLSVFADFFSIAKQEETTTDEETKPGEKPGKGRTHPGPPPRPPRKPACFRIQKIPGGFSVVPQESDKSLPSKLDIRVAYDVRRGSALRRYNKSDFQVSEAPIRLDPETHGLKVLELRDNHILIKILSEEFGLHVVGFDRRRQLYVRVIEKELKNADSED